MHLSMLNPSWGGGGGGWANNENLIVRFWVVILNVRDVPRVGLLIVCNPLQHGLKDI